MKDRQVGSHGEAGAALLIIAAILAVIAGLSIGTRYYGSSTRQLSQTKDAKIDYVRIEDAMAAYWETNSRLPCPADITETVVANIGAEERDAGDGSCDAAFAAQVIPWKTLGMPEVMARDAWGNYFAYHVQNPDLTKDLAKDTAGLVTTAITVKNTYNGAANIVTDAWFVVVSYGPNGAGAYNANKQPLAASTDPDEAENLDSETPMVFVKGGTPGSKFDDILTYWQP